MGVGCAALFSRSLRLCAPYSVAAALPPRGHSRYCPMRPPSESLGGGDAIRTRKGPRSPRDRSPVRLPVSPRPRLSSQADSFRLVRRLCVPVVRVELDPTKADVSATAWTFSVHKATWSLSRQKETPVRRITGVRTFPQRKICGEKGRSLRGVFRGAHTPGERSVGDGRSRRYFVKPS